MGRYLCQDCIRAKGLDNADRDAPLPFVMPELIPMTEIRDAPGNGATDFMAASEASKHDQPVEAVEKYLAAIEAGSTPPFEAVARNYVGGMFLKQCHIQAALLQFRRALFASPQAPETAHLAAIRFSIVSEELGATSQTKKAKQIAELAAARMKTAPPAEAVELIRQAVRNNLSSHGFLRATTLPKAVESERRMADLQVHCSLPEVARHLAPSQIDELVQAVVSCTWNGAYYQGRGCSEQSWERSRV